MAVRVQFSDPYKNVGKTKVLPKTSKNDYIVVAGDYNARVGNIPIDGYDMIGYDMI